MTIALAAGLATAKIGAAIVFVGAVLAIGVAYRSLRRRLEVERAEAVLEAEFDRLEAREADWQKRPIRRERVVAGKAK